jgi:ribosome maturation factor RimP
MEQNQLTQLTAALKQQILKELDEKHSQKSTNSRLEIGSPGDAGF